MKAQNRFTAVVLDSTSGYPITGVNVFIRGTKLGAMTDPKGKVIISQIPDGSQAICFSIIGYAAFELRVDFPLSDTSHVFTVRLREKVIELAGETVTATRTSYHIDDAPVRVEVKAEEDIGETMIDHPSSISELFLESTGMQVQQTSAVSNYINIKLQGLDGSYTQILKDGFPLYGGLSSGLSVTQIPPLDLSRVEVVTGDD